MTAGDFLAERFEADRAHLRAVALRMLGSRSAADDAVQETFLRLMRADTSGIANLTGWLTTALARVCLDMLRARNSRHEVPVDGEAEGVVAPGDTERETLIADSVGVAMLVVLETLPPAERVAFVLHDLFDVSFDVIAPVVGRSPAAARQLASRGRRRIRGSTSEPEADRARQRQLVEAFLIASQSGDFAALLALLDPDVVLRADAAAVAGSRARASRDVPALPPELRGREAVAEIFRNRARAARPATVDGEAGLVFLPDGVPRLLVTFVFDGDAIAEIAMIADPAAVAEAALQY
ncbi:MAG: sigma-70 family RNA polymerase sigma factor [Proteobacteria bacterium]|nr:sigma-70 family RNA polymerase sigma factor [Pseudomonadota bacterium]